MNHLLIPPPLCSEDQQPFNLFSDLQSVFLNNYPTLQLAGNTEQGYYTHDFTLPFHPITSSISLPTSPTSTSSPISLLDAPVFDSNCNQPLHKSLLDTSNIQPSSSTWTSNPTPTQQQAIDDIFFEFFSNPDPTTLIQMKVLPELTPTFPCLPAKTENITAPPVDQSPNKKVDNQVNFSIMDFNSIDDIFNFNPPEQISIDNKEFNQMNKKIKKNVSFVNNNKFKNFEKQKKVLSNSNTTIIPNNHLPNLEALDKNLKNILCTFCFSIFGRKCDRDRHVNSQHEKKVIKTCDVCGKNFNRMDSYLKHQRIEEKRKTSRSKKSFTL